MFLVNIIQLLNRIGIGSGPKSCYPGHSIITTSISQSVSSSKTINYNKVVSQEAIKSIWIGLVELQL